MVLSILVFTYIYISQLAGVSVDAEGGYEFSRVLAVAGGIIAIVFGALGVVTAGAVINREVLLATFSIVVGIIAVITSPDIKSETIDILLIVLGFIANNFGGILIGIAGIVALVSKYILSKEQKANEPPKV